METCSTGMEQSEAIDKTVNVHPAYVHDGDQSDESYQKIDLFEGNEKPKEEKAIYVERSLSAVGAEETQVEFNQTGLFEGSSPETEVVKDEFDRPPTVPGEISLPLSSLKDWQYHCAVMPRQSGSSDAGLIASAFDPDLIPPIEVISRSDGTHAVKDGRRRLQALRTVHHNKMTDTMVRCVLYHGTEGQAVEEMCDDAISKVARTPIQTAIAVANVHQITGVSQVGLTQRYPLKKDQVSRMIKAARVFKEYPFVFQLLKEPDRVPIDTCVRIHDHTKGASDEELGAFISRAQDQAAAGVSLTPGELLDAFGIEGSSKKAVPAKDDPFAPIDRKEIFGSDDQIIGSLDLHSDNIARLRLPDPHAMTINERAAAAKAFVQQIYAYFELDAG